MAEQKKFIIWGSSGHAKVLGSLIKSCGWQLAALFDNNPKAVSISPGVPLYIGESGFMNWLEHEKSPSEFYGLAAIGGARGVDRLFIHNYFRRHQIKIEPLIHPQASVCPSAKLGAGTQILAQSVVSSDVSIGEACIINHGVILDHECELGDGVHLAPHATLCGCVKVGGNTLVGAGAVILPRITIGQNVNIGAGSVVTKDLPPDVIVVGNPARLVQ